MLCNYLVFGTSIFYTNNALTTMGTFKENKTSTSVVCQKKKTYIEFKYDWLVDFQTL